MGICNKRGETLEGEPGFGRSDYCFPGPYARTETIPAAAARNLKRLTCSLMSSIARTLTWIWRELKRIGWKIFDADWETIKNCFKEVYNKCFDYQFRELYTYMLLSFYEKFIYKGSNWVLLFMPMVVIYLYHSPSTSPVTPDPETSYVQDAFTNRNSAQGFGLDKETLSSLPSENYVLIGLVSSWAILAIVNHLTHWYYAADRAKIEGFKMTYIYSMQFRFLGIGSFLSCLLLASIPSCTGLGFIMLGLFGFLTIITFMMYISRKYGGQYLWHDNKMYKKIDEARFQKDDIPTLKGVYDRRNPAIELDDQGTNNSSTDSAEDSSQTQPHSADLNSSQTQSHSAGPNSSQTQSHSAGPNSSQTQSHSAGPKSPQTQSPFAGYGNPQVPPFAGYGNPQVPPFAGYGNPQVPPFAGYGNPQGTPHGENFETSQFGVPVQEDTSRNTSN